VGAPRGPSTAALERLAWIAMPDAMPLFARAARSRDTRCARAALLGMARVLAKQADPQLFGEELVDAIQDHLATARDPAGTRTFLSTVLVAAGDHLAWLCARTLRRRQHEVAHVAALEAIGLSHRPEALELATETLLGATEDETLAAALRALWRVGHVPEEAHDAVIEDADAAHMGTRVQAAYALTWLPPDRALPTLWTLLGDRAWEVRRAAAFFALAVLYGLLVSLGTTALDVVLPHSPHRAADRFRLLNAVVTESLWYRPWLAFIRLFATFNVRAKRGKWGAMTRRSFG